MGSDWFRDRLTREPDPEELRQAEQRIATAKQHLRRLSYDLITYEQQFSDNLEHIQREYAQEPDDLSPEDAASGLQYLPAYTLNLMQAAVEELGWYFDRNRVLKGPRKKLQQLPPVEDRSYQGHIGAERLYDLAHEAYDLQSWLDDMNDRMTDLQEVQAELPAYISGEKTFEPAPAEITVQDPTDPEEAQFSYDRSRRPPRTD